MLRRWLAISVMTVMAGVAALPVFAVDLPPGGTFTDDDGSVHEGYIEAVAELGITRGCNPPDNTLFCPDEFVSRGEMAAFVVRALGYTDDGGGDLFTDDDASVFEGDIDRLGTAGVTQGCNPPDNTLYCPDEFVTRAQMASFLGRALGLTPNVPPPTSSTTIGDSTTSSTGDSSTSTSSTSSTSSSSTSSTSSTTSSTIDD